MQHITVLEREAVEGLALTPSSTVVDCTFGSGGHSARILGTLGPQGHLVALDVDKSAVETGETMLRQATAKIDVIESNFTEIDSVLTSLGLTHVDGVLADLGWRMEQFNGSAGEKRGFSFSAEEPLLMTFGESSRYAFTAKDIVNEWAEEDIANVIFGYGEERYSRRIARAITKARETSPITTSLELAAIVESALPNRRGKTHPATKTFQALRIAVNDEFTALETLLAKGFAALAPGGRMSIISFHSLEDRIVKHTFRNYIEAEEAVAITKKPVIASEEELEQNPRARSAKLRIIEKL